MFSERLHAVARRIEGVQSLSLVAKDGIPVESIKLNSGLDLDILAAELMSQVRAISHHHQDLAIGRVRHFSVSTERLTLMVTALTDDYYLMLVLAAGGNSGRARFELRRSTLLFEDDLR
jgi:predicted regulator of Ras-like GTPase activity (Roadblock/LC7/MglB family)